MDTSPVPDYGLSRLFRRCVQCPPTSTQLKCPACPAGKVCTLIPPSCNQCAHMECVTDPNPAGISQGPNVGAIAGGVVGGAALIVLLVFLVWLFWIKKRREQQDQELQEEWAQDKRSTRLNSLRDSSSARTRGSLANSMLSRASNFIQIAYIPGVTNRNGSGRNSVHSPVPPIPAAHRQRHNQPNKSPLSGNGDALFFGIDDLRGSTYSAGSSVRDTRHANNRDTRYTMQSITPSLARDSVASDVFWDDATAAPMPATTVARVAPRMVSVKGSSNSSANTTPGSDSAPGTPPEHLPHGASAESSPAAGDATKRTSKGRFPVRAPNDNLSTRLHIPLIPSPLADNTTATAASNTPSEAAHSRDLDSLMQHIDFSTPPADAQPIESPFFDASDLPHAATAASSMRANPYASMASTVGVGTRRLERSLSPHRRRGGSKGNIGGLSAVIEEATKRASTGGVVGAEDSPFGDEHATHE
ncbi:hypothetical protein BDY17DRAFT_322155 [Neohortaea acidophila]|uniref:Membrane anchor Opy2 N-terminal domain-containing protein n=1 Tax=Neohortaea acidophila TaxID=245834 RepID=A0A6A6PZX6_9PEZI|nr:uncharacterized protein BDY17DRAFT_322155 [Neohortaea acidophila]KAF2485296.1 hypothetical protein BDY17DRAFT_322155 [Neohortaea acidophila]